MTNEKIVNFIRQRYPNVKLIYLFGSRGSNKHTEKSDWDIAVLNDAKIGSLARWDISEKLAAECNTDVDFIDLRAASTVMKMQIVENGQLLFDLKNYAGYFEIQAMGMYSKLQESRKDIINSFITKVKAKGEKHA